MTAREYNRIICTTSRHVIYHPAVASESLSETERWAIKQNPARIMDARTRQGQLHVRILSNGQWVAVGEKDRIEIV